MDQGLGTRDQGLGTGDRGPGTKIYVAGHTGLIGSALVRYFFKQGSVRLIVAPHSELELTDQTQVSDFLSTHRPDVVICAAGFVGGILANSKYPAEFIYKNLMIEANLIHAAWRAGVQRLLNFGSSCVYPKNSPQPITTDMLMTGPMEATNEPYGIAKLAGMSLCESYNRQYGTAYLNVIPSNIYGPGDNYDLEKCHVISAAIRKFHEAKAKGTRQVTFWGSGNVTRDFLFVDDMARACALLLEKYRGSRPIHAGAQRPCRVRDLVEKIKGVVGFEGKVVWDISKPDGAPQRILDAAEIKKLGFVPKIDLDEGLRRTYEWFVKS
ncbi:MAG: GDP-L-fucose synthase [Deltaproteobacteria bacterium]|nr:GDP-L-fucose synthase [Deltaproteobacteria bacterium]